MPEFRPARMSVTVEYFAALRDCARKPSETVEIESASAAEVYAQLHARYTFPLESDHVHLAINDAYASWDTPLQPGDRLVFLPPVCGG